MWKHAEKHDAGRVKKGRVAGWKEMEGYTEDMLDKQAGVGGSGVRCDSLSFICHSRSGAAHVCACSSGRELTHRCRKDSFTEENTRATPSCCAVVLVLPHRVRLPVMFYFISGNNSPVS